MDHREMKRLVDSYLTSLETVTPAVAVELVDRGDVLASARGIRLGTWAFGKICINRRLTEELTDDELRFILAHEAVHINHRHLVATAAFEVGKEVLERLGREKPLAAGLNLGVDLYRAWNAVQGELPLSAEITRYQEIEADALGILLTRDRRVALRCLRKLVGDDLLQPSHEWEVFDVPQPVMTMEERIDYIENVLAQWEEMGYDVP